MLLYTYYSEKEKEEEKERKRRINRKAKRRRRRRNKNFWNAGDENDEYLRMCMHCEWECKMVVVVG